MWAIDTTKATRRTVSLTIASTPEGESLYRPNGTVYGMVSDPSWRVWVIGVEAAVTANGGWVAEAVPVRGGLGTAVFEAWAAPAGGGSGAAAVAVEKERPACVLVVGHTVRKRHSHWNWSWEHFTLNHYNLNTVLKGYTNFYGTELGATVGWMGTATNRSEYRDGWYEYAYAWTATHRTTWFTNRDGTARVEPQITEQCGAVTRVPDGDWQDIGWTGCPPFVQHYHADGVGAWTGGRWK